MEENIIQAEKSMSKAQRHERTQKAAVTERPKRQLHHMQGETYEGGGEIKRDQIMHSLLGHSMEFRFYANSLKIG